MDDFPFLELSAYMGLVATGLLTLNIMLGKPRTKAWICRTADCLIATLAAIPMLPAVLSTKSIT